MQAIDVNGNPDAYVYTTSLNFTHKTLNKIIEEIYDIEKNNYSSPSGRTFKITNGFHSVNLLDKNNKILEKYFYLSFLCSRVQEIVFNTMKVKKTNLNFLNIPGALEISEIWCNILRKGDYNIPHNHGGFHISGNFYLNKMDPKKKSHSTDGQLCFMKLASYDSFIPNSGEGIIQCIEPKPNFGVIFRSWKRHVVLPHFSDEDRIGIAFNAKYNPKWSYDKIYPIPYWVPHKINYLIKEKDIDENNKLKIELDLSWWKRFKETKDIQNIKLNMKLDNKIKNKNIKLKYENLKSLLTLYPPLINKLFLQ